MKPASNMENENLKRSKFMKRVRMVRIECVQTMTREDQRDQRKKTAWGQQR